MLQGFNLGNIWERIMKCKELFNVKCDNWVLPARYYTLVIAFSLIFIFWLCYMTYIVKCKYLKQIMIKFCPYLWNLLQA